MFISFTPTPDVAVIINHLLDIFERRDGAPKQAVRVQLNQLKLPGYYSQIDPTPRVTTNEQLVRLAQQEWVDLTWEPGQTEHLLDTVTLNPAQTDILYKLLERQPVAEQRQYLRELLLAERSHLSGWRRKAVEHCLTQLSEHKSATPFSLTNLDWNQDLLTILLALPDEESRTETPYRVFSVRVFNDSKQFEPFKDTVARLARRHNPLWHHLNPADVLREMGLVANPNHLYLSGPWQLTDSDGQIMSLAEFHPSVGIPAALANKLRRVEVETTKVICVENLATFYELIRYEGQGIATLCLWGNPSPVTRHLLRCLVNSLPDSIPLLLWADIDYGGLNILAQLRGTVSPRFTPYRMDIPTLQTHTQWAHPLSKNDQHNLTQIRQQAKLQDMTPLIDYMLLADIKLEQEAIVLKDKQ